MELGKLVRTLKEPCPECENKILELRKRQHSNKVKGIEINDEKEYKRCSRCGYESNEKKNKKSNNKKDVLEEEIW